MLGDIHPKLLSEELLPTRANIRNHAVENRIIGDVRKDRHSVIHKAISFPIRREVSIKDLDKLLNEIKKFTSNSDNSIPRR